MMPPGGLRLDSCRKQSNYSARTSTQTESMAPSRCHATKRPKHCRVERKEKLQVFDPKGNALLFTKPHYTRARLKTRKNTKQSTVSRKCLSGNTNAAPPGEKAGSAYVAECAAMRQSESNKFNCVSDVIHCMKYCKCLVPAAMLLWILFLFLFDNLIVGDER